MISHDDVVMFGSAISCSSPSNVPTGIQITNAILEWLFPSSVFGAAADIREFPYPVPFEVLNDRCPKDLRHGYGRLLEADEPNPLHFALARLAIESSIAGLITTNCDTGVEQGALFLGKALHPIVKEEDRVPSDEAPLLKLHGSCSDISTIICSLSGEAALDSWKIDHLDKCLYKRELHIFGYSGIDFEICPVIAESAVKRVVWYVKPGHRGISAGQEIVRRSGKLEMKEWDLSHGFPWHSVLPTLTTDQSTISKLSQVLREFSDDQRYLWAIKVAAGLGHAKLGDILIQAEDNRNDDEWIWETGFVHFQAGRYKYSAKVFTGQLIRRLVRQGAGDAAVASFHASNAWSSYGARARYLASGWIGTFLTLIAGGKRIKLKARALKWIAGFVQHVRESFAKFIFSERALITIRRRLLFMTLDSAKKCGDMYLVKQAGAELMALQQDDNCRDAFSLFYKQLGYAGGLITGHGDLAQTAVDLPELKVRFATAHRIENYPAAWRLAAIIATLADKEERAAWKQQSLECLSKCQFSRRKRKLIMHRELGSYPS
jgi:hypothetical protein